MVEMARSHSLVYCIRLMNAPRGCFHKATSLSGNPSDMQRRGKGVETPEVHWFKSIPRHHSIISEKPYSVKASTSDFGESAISVRTAWGHSSHSHSQRNPRIPVQFGVGLSCIGNEDRMEN